MSGIIRPESFFFIFRILNPLGYGTRLDTRLPQSRAGGQGPYLRSPEHLGRSGKAKKLKNAEKVKCDGPTDRRTDRPTDGPTDRRTDKAGCRVACTRLKKDYYKWYYIYIYYICIFFINSAQKNFQRNISFSVTCYTTLLPTSSIR